jgi:hypothetical protein
VEDDAAFVAADREPVGCDLDLAGGGFRASEVSWGEEDALVVVEALGKVGEEFGENLAFASLGAEELRQDYPLRYLIRYGSVAFRDVVLLRLMFQSLHNEQSGEIPWRRFILSAVPE